MLPTITACTFMYRSQSLFYWITYSYKRVFENKKGEFPGLNPYFIGLPILMVAKLR